MTPRAQPAAPLLIAAPLHGVPCHLCVCSTNRLAAALPSGFTLDQTELLPQYVCEVIRRFAPVSGFAYVERSAGSGPPHTAMLSLHSAQNDPAAWGDSVNSFLLRPMEEYAAKSVGFAEPAQGLGRNASPLRDAS